MTNFRENRKLTISKDGVIIQADILLEETNDIENRCVITLSFLNEIIQIKSRNFFSCLEQLKKEFPNILIFCKGYKKNVYPSRMGSQTSLGLMAYEMQIGHPARRNDLVDIFDFENSNLTSSNEEQRTFFYQWLESL